MELLRKYVVMFRQDMRQVMSKRCGQDELNNFLMLVGFVFIVLSMLTHRWIFTLLGAVFVVLSYLRVFSVKIEKRRKENEIYMRYLGGVVRKVHHYKLCVKMKLKTSRDPEFSYFVCSHCGQIIRVPKGKNKVSIRCPRCSETFIRKT